MKQKNTVYGSVLMVMGIVVMIVSKTVSGSGIKDFISGVLLGIAIGIMLVGAYAIGRGLSKKENSMDYDCCFTKENNWFRYRAAAIIVENECVLLAGNANENYLYSVGGGVHLNERAEDAVRREVFEETGVQYEIDRLAVIHENFFSENEGALKGLSCHEIAFYYLMKPRGTQELHSDSYTLNGIKEEMHWIPIADLDQYKAFPSFLKEYLNNINGNIVHIVTDERK